MFFTPTPDSGSIPGAVRRGVAGAAGRGLTVLLGAAALVAVAGVALRSESWSMGAPRVLLAVVAGLGTGVASLLPVAAALGTGAWWASWRERGDAGGLAALGIGAADLVRTLLPLAIALTVVAAAWGWIVEPIAWRRIHDVRGAPAVAAAGWEELRAGRVRAVPGGVIALEDGRLLAATDDLAIDGEAQGLAPAGSRWAFASAAVVSPRARWTTGRGVLRPTADVEAAWTTPPRSPWAASLATLASRPDDRGRRVFHRRLALPLASGLWLLLPLLPILRGRRAGALALLWLLAVRQADQAAVAGVLGPALAGWAPVWLLLPALGSTAWERRW